MIDETCVHAVERDWRTGGYRCMQFPNLAENQVECPCIRYKADEDLMFNRLCRRVVRR